MSGIQRYLDEYEKYKHVELHVNTEYCKKSKQTEKVILLEIDEEKETALVKNVRTENIQHKTLHWCRKNLIKE